MISWLRQLPDIAVFLVVIIPMLILTLAAARLPARFRGKEAELNSEGFDTFLAVASAVAVLIAFSLIQVDTATRATEDVVSKEAAAINSLDRVLTRYGDAKLTEFRPRILDYVRAVIDDEWPKLAHGQRSAAVDRHYVAISKAVRIVEPSTPRQIAMYSEALKYLDDVADLREQRINAANNGLPTLFWGAIAAIIGLMLALVARMEPRAERLWTTGIVISVISILISLVIIVDAPFHGEANSVGADAIGRAIQQMTART